MKALFRAAVTTALLALLMLVLPVAAASAHHNDCHQSASPARPATPAEPNQGEGPATPARPATPAQPASGGPCPPDNGNDNDPPANQQSHAGENGNSNNAGGNGNNTDDGDNVNNAGGNGNNADNAQNDDAANDDGHPHGDDMPGRGLGHCRNYPNEGHDAAEHHGRGHLRDGGECEDEATGGDNTDDDDDDDDVNRDDDDDDDDVNRNGDDDDDDDDDNGRTRRAGDGRMPIDFVDADNDGFDDTTGMTLEEVEAFNAASTEGEVVAAGSAGPILEAVGAADAVPGAAVPTPGRIDAGLGWMGLSAGQNLLALVGMAVALTLAFASLVRRGTVED